MLRLEKIVPQPVRLPPAIALHRVVPAWANRDRSTYLRPEEL
jgi:hypothetical protein